MSDFIKNIIYLIVSLIIIASVIAIFWTNLAYSYFIRFILSAGFVFVGFYYLFRSKTKNNISIGLTLIVLSPISYYILGLLFPYSPDGKKNYRVISTPVCNGKDFFYNLWYDIKYGFFERYIYIGWSSYKIGTIFLLVLFLYNGLVLMNKPTLSRFIGANLLAIFTTILIFILFA